MSDEHDPQPPLDEPLPSQPDPELIKELEEGASYSLNIPEGNDSA